MPASSQIRSTEVERVSEEIRDSEGLRAQIRDSLVERARAAGRRLPRIDRNGRKLRPLR
jgi:hypothetical protein